VVGSEFHRNNHINEGEVNTQSNANISESYSVREDTKPWHLRERSWISSDPEKRNRHSPNGDLASVKFKMPIPRSGNTSVCSNDGQQRDRSDIDWMSTTLSHRVGKSKYKKAIIYNKKGSNICGRQSKAAAKPEFNIDSSNRNS